MKHKKIMFILTMLFVSIPFTAYCQEGPRVDAGDTAFVLLSAALVMLMTPGLAMFYGGMVRKKNVLGTLMHSYVAIALVSVQWILIGYTLAFGPDIMGVIGNLDWAGLRGVGFTPNADYAPTVPHMAFMIYQAMFAVITPALISGAVAERMKFSAYLVFILLWTTLVYDPVAHWVWGTGGWMKGLGTLDFAGGVVVHVTSGISALAAALYMGRRKNYLREQMPPHNLPMTVLGAGLLWFGWFGFNAGSALSSGALSTVAFVTTHAAAVAATLTWVVIEWLHRGKPTMFGAATGSIAGLATITPAAGFVSPLSALVIGLAAGAICYTALTMKVRLGYDDSLDAFGVHGIGGMLGTLGAGLLAEKLINPAGSDGLFFGNAHQFYVQLVSILAAASYSFILTIVLLTLIKATIGLRVTEEEELIGLDLTQHEESGYTL